jgi:hypothetical protein
MIEDEQPAGLIVAPDGAIQIGKFTVTAKGLISDESVLFEEWQQLGELLKRFEASIQWLIGDWMAYGERHWGQTYEAVAEATGYKIGTLYEYARVARGVDFSIRIEKLSFAHHQLVAGMSPEDQQQWLIYASENDLSVSQMRKAMDGNAPTLPSQHVYDRLFARENKPNISRIEKLYIRAGQGDQRASDNLLSQIEQIRRWLDEIEQLARTQSKK